MGASWDDWLAMDKSATILDAVTGYPPPIGISRRVLIGAVPAAAAVQGRLSPVDADDTWANCREWLNVEAEIRELSLRWSDLEVWLADNFNWLKLSDEQCAAIPEAKELDVINGRIDALWARRDELSEILSKTTATDGRSIAGKLAVAAGSVPPDEDEETHLIITGALRELYGLKCRCCGASIVHEG
jgi:hypothetical protein